jgi:hypothetical protein
MILGAVMGDKIQIKNMMNGLKNRINMGIPVMELMSICMPKLKIEKKIITKIMW